MESDTSVRTYLLFILLFVVTALSAAAPAHAAGLCTNPTYTTTQNISFSFGSGLDNYTVAHDLWNIGPYPDSSWTLQVCNFDSWNELAVANNNSGDGAVKAYPNVHRDYNSQPLISSIPLISVAFAGTAWNSGIYDVAFDIWTRNYQKEIMIWTENHNQLPGGSRVVSNLSISGYTWDLWQSGTSYFAFAPPLDQATGKPQNRTIASGTFDVKAFLTYLIATGKLASNSKLQQLDYGIEVVDTGNVQQTFSCTNFAITDH